MKKNVDQVAALDLLRDEGRISDEEYEDLKTEVLEIADVPTGESGENEEQNPSSAESTSARSGDGQPEKSEDARWPALRIDLSPVYLGVLLITSVVLLLASSLGVLSWLVTTVAILGLGATLVQGGHWVTIAGGVAVAGIVIVGLLGGGDNPSTVQGPVDNVELAPAASAPTVPGSLGINLEDLTDLWNFPAGPPRITSGLVRNNEPGQYDSFIYRFGDWGRLAGAYDPSTDALYALLATGQLSNEATAQLYLHLCFVLNPYSQGCIDSYFEKGLADGTLADFGGVSYKAEWQIDDQTWRLDIEGNVLTIRVLGTEVS
ncbi:MAG: SHOCT domain-containing protein [Acidimicrobiia bacterium]